MELVWIFGWVAAALLVAHVANNKGRHGGKWFLLSLLISPLLGLIAIAAMPVGEAATDTKTCPKCAEAVKLAAVVCKHCGNEFENAPRQAIYAGVPYTILSDGSVSMTVEGKTTTWPNLAAFQQHVDKKRMKVRP